MDTVASKDGTRIAFWRSGEGPPLLLVHGGSADHSTTWRFVLPELERRFTVYAMDRRGRGGSEDSAAYDLQREAEDVAGIVDSIRAPVHVLGHSYGGLCAFEAALISPNLNRLILYEAVPLRGSDNYEPGAIEDLEALLDTGDVEGMLVAMYRRVVQMPDNEIELLRSQQDAWSARLRNTPTIPREMKGERSYVFDPARFGTMRTPTLLLVGGDSPARELRNAQGLAEVLPDARIRILPGQQHAATYTAPELFVREVEQFLQS